MIAAIVTCDNIHGADTEALRQALPLALAIPPEMPCTMTLTLNDTLLREVDPHLSLTAGPPTIISVLDFEEFTAPMFPRKPSGDAIGGGGYTR